MREGDVYEQLPLKSAWLHILLSVANGPQHGYAIRVETEERTGGRVKLWPATLYGSIRDLVEAGILAEEATDDDDDPRRRCYGLTTFGREVLRAETERLESIVSVARSSEALTGGEG